MSGLPSTVRPNPVVHRKPEVSKLPGGNITLGIVSHQRIADSMAGPAIRCWEFARALADTADVRLFSPEESGLAPEGFDLITYSDKTLVKQVSSCDEIGRAHV